METQNQTAIAILWHEHRGVPLITYSATVVSLWNSSENNKTNFLAFWILHSLYGWLKRAGPQGLRWVTESTTMMMEWLWQRNAGTELDGVNVLGVGCLFLVILFHLHPNGGGCPVQRIWLSLSGRFCEWTVGEPFLWRLNGVIPNSSVNHSLSNVSIKMKCDEK